MNPKSASGEALFFTNGLYTILNEAWIFLDFYMHDINSALKHFKGKALQWFVQWPPSPGCRLSVWSLHVLFTTDFFSQSKDMQVSFMFVAIS